VLRRVVQDANSEAVLLVDATNAFNSLNRHVALQNVLHLCPSIAPAIVNTYRADAQLFVDGEVIYSREGTTQGDPLAMAMYAIATIPLIHKLGRLSQVKQVWFADDASAGGQLHQLKHWWDKMEEIGPDFGYYANATKSWLIVKEEHTARAAELFQGTDVQITNEGQRHLGAALGSRTFVETYVTGKVQEWVREIEQLAAIASSQPHAAYAALTHGLSSKWSYLSRTISNISDLFQPLENAIRYKFLPALTGRSAFTEQERDLFALPTRLGGLGIPNPTKSANFMFDSSQQVTGPLTALILQQHQTYPSRVENEQTTAVNKVKAQQRRKQAAEAALLRENLSSDLQKSMDFGSEKGASSWLGVLPLTEHGFNLHKGAFRDAISLRYGWQLTHLPSNCVCGKHFTVEHAFSCAQGGFPSLRHNDVRDITANLLAEVCHNVAVEPDLQTLSGEQFQHRTTNTEDGARLDVRAQGFWGDKHQGAFFDIRVFNPYAPSNCKSTMESVYRRHEREKRRCYERRILEVEHGSFTPLVFSAVGGMGTAATVMYKRLASLLADKHAQSYSKTMSWIRCLLNFSLLRSAIMCVRGARSTSNRACRTTALCEGQLDLVASEGKIPNC